MFFLKIIRYHHAIHRLPQFQPSSNYIKNPNKKDPHFCASSNSYQFHFPYYSVAFRNFSLSAQVQEKSPDSENSSNDLSGKAVESSVDDGDSEVYSAIDCENADLIERLRVLAEEVRSLNKGMNGNVEILKLDKAKYDWVKPNWKRRRLYEFFLDKEINEEVNLEPFGIEEEFATDYEYADLKESKLEPSDLGIEDSMIRKELSPSMLKFTYHLYKRGYLNDATFIQHDPLDLLDFTQPFEFSEGRRYLKFAAEEFGKDHPEIAKWLHTSDLKNVASFGCPSLCKSIVSAAKNLRRYFSIEEEEVCQKCILKESCEFANKRFKKEDTELYLVDVIRVLVMYAMESTPQQLVVPTEVKISVNRTLEKIIVLNTNSDDDDYSVSPFVVTHIS